MVQQRSWQWGILGAGTAATAMAEALQRVNGGAAAIASRSPDRARDLATRFGIRQVHASPAALLEDPALDVVYVATPHDSHYDYLKAAVLAGKHVLCEKAITLNVWQLDEVTTLACARGVVVAEAMTIYHMPLYRRLRSLLISGYLGRVRLVQVNFGSWREPDPASRFFSRTLAGGALLDIGVYAAAFARWFLDEMPHRVLTTVECFAETGVDEQSGIILQNGQGQMAVMALSLRARQPKRGVIACEKGYIEIDDYPRADRATLVWSEDGRVETIASGQRLDAFCYEIEDMQYCLDQRTGGQMAGKRLTVSPSMRCAGLSEAMVGDLTGHLTLSRDVMAILTDVRQQWGIVYPGE